MNELIDDINTLAKDGIKVTHGGMNFTYKAFLFSWVADASGRMKLLGIGGPANYVSFSKCWQHGTYLCKGTWYPGGYAKPIRVWVTEGGGHYVDMYASNYSHFEINQWCPMFSALYCCPFLVNEVYVGCSYFSYLLLGADYFQRDH